MAIVRFVATFTAVIAVYYLLPLSARKRRDPASERLLGFALTFVFVGVVLWWQLRQILRADFPALRAVEGVAVVMPFFLCVVRRDLRADVRGEQRQLHRTPHSHQLPSTSPSSSSAPSDSATSLRSPTVPAWS